MFKISWQRILTSVGADPAQSEVVAADDGRFDGIPQAGFHTVQELRHQVNLLHGWGRRIFRLSYHRLGMNRVGETIAD